MPASHAASSVRQHERFECRLPAELTVAPAHAELLRPVRTGGESASLAATIVDCGGGGLGINSPVFVPKHAQLLVRLAHAAVEFSAPVRVMRVLMIDRVPTYYLGCAFTESGAAHAEALARLVALARKSAPGTAGA